MRPAMSVLAVRPDEALLMGAAGVVLVAGLTVAGHSPLAYLVVALPVVIGVSWWRPAYGFAALLGLAFVTEEFEIGTLAPQIQPLLLQALPIFRNLNSYTPLGGVYANAVELWLVLLAAVWLVQGVLAGRLRLRPVPYAAAWALGGLTVALTFALGVAGGGDLKPALWEVRALGYLFALAWLVPQLVERRQDLVVLLSVVSVAFGFKAVQGLYRYFVVLGRQLDINETFMAHEDPIMFVPLIYLLVALHLHGNASRLQRLLLAGVPCMLAALVLTQRRIAYVTLIVCGLYFAAALSAAARRRYLAMAVPAVALGAAYVWAFIGTSSPFARPIERALSLFDSSNPSNLYRIIELANLRDTIRAHPWGLGFGHPYEMVRALPRLEFPLYEYIPHNEILWVWAKAGTVGFVLVLFFFARVVAESVLTYRQVREPLLRAVALIVGLAIVNQLIASYYELQLTYARNMIFLGTLIGLLGPIREWGAVDPPRGRRWRL